MNIIKFKNKNNVSLQTNKKQNTQDIIYFTNIYIYKIQTWLEQHGIEMMKLPLKEIIYGFPKKEQCWRRERESRSLLMVLLDNTDHAGKTG
jgi:hypothetical protein